MLTNCPIFCFFFLDNENKFPASATTHNQIFFTIFASSQQSLVNSFCFLFDHIFPPNVT